MKEKNLAIGITAILIVLGLILGTLTITIKLSNFSSGYSEFNFYKSELKINQTNIHEKLYFFTDQEYHTLFRDFQSQITTKNNYVKNSIIISSVKCIKGQPYFRVSGLCYLEPDFSEHKTCPPYTEDNEYGCTFRDFYGFAGNSEYLIESDYSINPENLFYINGNYYVKFIAYGRNSHKDLLLNNSLFITGEAVYINKYSYRDYVIIYIPFKGNIENFRIISQDTFEYGSQSESLNYFFIFLIIIAHLIPGVLFIIFWFFFGKEISDEDVPDQLSTFPNERKPWEVAAFFSPPFGQINKDFFSTLLIDFYRRKIIDIKLIDGIFKKELMIKINKQLNRINLDKIEEKFYRMITKTEDNCNEKYKQGEYFNLNKAYKSYITKITLQTDIISLKSAVEKESKKYLEKKGIAFFAISMAVLFFISAFAAFIGLAILSVISIIIASLIAVKSPLLLKYKGQFYNEYQKWKAFKKWLSYSPSIKESGAKAIVMWEEYLVYATSLGISKAVLKELKQEGLINSKNYEFYSGINIAAPSFALSSGGSSGSGGFGGAGGGGAGGGGGGGR